LPYRSTRRFRDYYSTDFRYGRGTAIEQLTDMHSMIVVCGPSGSGKSTYVQQHRQPGEDYWDFDEEMARISGKPMWVKDSRFMDAVINLRDSFVRSHDNSNRRSWFVAMEATTPIVQAMLHSGAQLVTLEVDYVERMKRLTERKVRGSVREQLGDLY
jgi:hypothetical protein